ncbi:MAG: nucleotidyltransferase family protein [Acidimicrobiales bacterium]|jgi:hypothetical protein|nr:nucleotidyltransferase family protein [Acidimicrobiales bacterium]
MRPQPRWLPAGDDELLLIAALYPDDRGAVAWRQLRPRFDLDRADGEQVRLLPLVHRTLRAAGLDDPDLPRIVGLRRLAWMRTRHLLRGAEEALAALVGAGVPAMALKGTALASVAYEHAALRPMTDIDVLVPPRHVDDAVAVLAGLGYAGRPLADRQFYATRHGVPLHRADGVAVDVHWMAHRSLGLPGLARTRPWDPAATGVRPDEWWERAEPLRLGDSIVLSACPTDHLVHTCLHGAFGGHRNRLRWVADSAALLRTQGDRIDWSLLVAQARRRRVSPTLAEAFRFLRGRAGLDVPSEVVEALGAAPRGPRARVAHRVETRPLPGPVPLVGHLPNTAVRYLLLTRHEPALDAARGFRAFLAAVWGSEDVAATAWRRGSARIRAPRRPAWSSSEPVGQDTATEVPP